VQLRSSFTRATLAAAALCAVPGSALAADALDTEPVVGSMLRLFTDSEQIAVRSLMGNYAFSMWRDAGVTLHWNNERVTIPAVKAPPGTDDAVDAITTASRPIAGNAFEDYVKVRNEVQGELERGPATFQYYVSSESDYLAQQLGATMNRDFMDQQLNVSMGTSYGWDAIAPLADDDTRTAADQKSTIHWNAVATRVLTPTTMLRLGLEYNVVNGLQHNPYRNVYAGGGHVPERHPEHRERRDAFLKLSQYLNQRSSVKLGYRFYDDDWGIASHELDSRLSQYLVHGLYARWEYRWYTQTPATFWRDEYEDAEGVGGYRSGDYRMGPLSSHLFGLALDLDLDAFAVENERLKPFAVRIEYDRYFNSNNYSANILEAGLDYKF
jgi:hypothetical protein